MKTFQNLDGNSFLKKVFSLLNLLTGREFEMVTGVCDVNFLFFWIILRIY